MHDSLTYLQATATHLRDDGCEVITAHSGEEALEFLAVQPLDCILPDLIMPGLSGQEPCRRMGSNFRCTRSTPRERPSFSPKFLVCFASTGVKDAVLRMGLRRPQQRCGDVVLRRRVPAKLIDRRK